jgi:hypothetical protein
MVSLPVVGSGLLVFAMGGWAFRNPQRFYEIRQWGQTLDDPTLSDTGRLIWQGFHLVFVLLGLAIIAYGLTM